MAPVETRAWQRSVLPPLPRVPTMLTPEERLYLHWLGAVVWSGRGCVVEIGPWLGGSTVCLAAGMRASGHPARGAWNVRLRAQGFALRTAGALTRRIGRA